MGKRVCFTGHRNIAKEEYIPLFRKLIDKVEALAREGYTVFNTGGAIGFDTMAAQAVLRARRKYPNIELHLYLPFPQQADNWPKTQRYTYEYIKEQADKINYATPDFKTFALNMRNRQLVNNADYCVAFCHRPTGGTAYTLGYAIDEGLPFVNLAQ